MSLHTRLLTLVSVAALPLLAGCTYEHDHYRDHDGVYGRQAGYYERREGWRHDRDWDHDRHDGDRDHDRRWDHDRF